MFNQPELKSYINSQLHSSGPNKRRESMRLIYEIAKKESIPYQAIFSEYYSKFKHIKYNHFKNYLIKRRYPKLSLTSEEINPPSIHLNINEKYRTKIKKLNIQFKNIYIEERVAKTPLSKKMQKAFPDANIHIITSHQKYVKSKKFTIDDYNNRTDSLFIVKGFYEKMRKCPCSPGTLNCGYHIVDFGRGCPYECVYCYLQGYVNYPGIVLPANIDDFFDLLDTHAGNIRIGSGEYTDSLVYDHLTEFSPKIMEYFRSRSNKMFEFKTKSTNVQLLTSVKPPENILISWSVNPQNVIDAIEYYTPSLQQRLKAAKKCIHAGYRVAFHFDPIIYSANWQKEYKHVIDMIFKTLDAASIEWISLGCLRMTQKLKSTIENRFPDNTILDEEIILGFDNKVRYGKHIRIDIYKNMLQWIHSYSKAIKIYLCMEEPSIYHKCKLTSLTQQYVKN